MFEDSNLLLNAKLNLLVKPLVLILLRHRVAFDDLVEAVRRSYVLVADQEFVPLGEKQSVSNVALVTGIHQHEVKRLMDCAKQESPLPVRVIHGWLTDPEFSDQGFARHLITETEYKQLVGMRDGEITLRPKHQSRNL